MFNFSIKILIWNYPGGQKKHYLSSLLSQLSKSLSWLLDCWRKWVFSCPVNSGTKHGLLVINQSFLILWNSVFSVLCEPPSPQRLLVLELEPQDQKKHAARVLLFHRSRTCCLSKTPWISVSRIAFRKWMFTLYLGRQKMNNINKWNTTDTMLMTNAKEKNKAVAGTRKCWGKDVAISNKGLRKTSQGKWH